MWQLRLIIVLIGVVFIALVYLLSRQRRQRRAEPVRTEPTLDGDAPPPLAPPESLARIAIPATAGLPTAVPGPDAHQLILSLHVVCGEANRFDGAQVLSALQANGLEYGQYRVFHRFLKNAPQWPVFSVASLVEPGVLPPDSLPQLRLPGLTLFLVLPGPQDGVAACADMLATARALARQLGGAVLDERRQPLTPESAQRIRQRILEFQQLPTAAH